MKADKLFQVLASESKGLICLSSGASYFYQGQTIDLQNGWYFVDINTGFICCKVISDLVKVIEKKVEKGEIIEIGEFSLIKGGSFYTILFDPSAVEEEDDEEEEGEEEEDSPIAPLNLKKSIEAASNEGEEDGNPTT